MILRGGANRQALIRFDGDDDPAHRSGSEPTASGNTPCRSIKHGTSTKSSAARSSIAPRLGICDDDRAGLSLVNACNTSTLSGGSPSPPRTGLRYPAPRPGASPPARVACMSPSDGGGNRGKAPGLARRVRPRFSRRSRANSSAFRRSICWPRVRSAATLLAYAR